MTSAVSISEAARLTGKNRRTLHRHIEAGRLSVSHDASGAPQIEIVELLRVYGPLKHAPKSQDVSVGEVEVESQQATPEAPAMPQANNLELVTLRAEVDKLQALLEAKERHIQSLDRALLAIEHTTKTPQPHETYKAPEPKGFWRSLLGR